MTKSVREMQKESRGAWDVAFEARNERNKANMVLRNARNARVRLDGLMSEAYNRQVEARKAVEAHSEPGKTREEWGEIIESWFKEDEVCREASKALDKSFEVSVRELRASIVADEASRDARCTWIGLSRAWIKAQKERASAEAREAFGRRNERPKRLAGGPYLQDT